MPMFSFQQDAFIGWPTIRRITRLVAGAVVFAALIAFAGPPMPIEVALVAVVAAHMLLRFREVSLMAATDVVIPDYPPFD